MQNTIEIRINNITQYGNSVEILTIRLSSVAAAYAEEAVRVSSSGDAIQQAMVFPSIDTQTRHCIGFSFSRWIGVEKVFYDKEGAL